MTQTKTVDFKVKDIGIENKRILQFVGSTAAPDRDGDILEVNGWELDNYRKNPVLLWAHDYKMPPIGRAIKVAKQNGKLVFDIQFPHEGIYPFADTVYELYKGGFMNATSVGFIGKEWVERDDEAVRDVPKWQRGRRYTKHELLELSAVPVPSNPQALQLAKAKGIIGGKQAKYFEDIEIEIEDDVTELDIKATDEQIKHMVIHTIRHTLRGN